MLSSYTQENPFPKFDPARELSLLNHHQPINDFYENTDNRPFGIVFLGVESQGQLEVKIRAFTLSLFHTAPRPVADKDDLKGRKIQLQNSSARQKRAQQSALLAKRETWVKMRQEIAPVVLKFADKIGSMLQKAHMIESYIETPNQAKLTAAENTFQPYAEFLAFSPKAIIFAWETLRDIEAQIKEAEKEVSAKSSKKQDVEGLFLQKYREFLEGFRRDILNQKNKIWTASQKIVETLKANHNLSELDTLLKLSQQLKECEVQSIVIPELAEPIEYHELDQLFAILALKDGSHPSDCGKLVSYSEAAALQLQVCIGPCQQGTVCYPSFEATRFSNKVHAMHSWPTYQGPTPTAIWRYNLFVRLFDQHKNGQLGIFTPGLQTLLEELIKIDKILNNKLEEKESALIQSWQGVLLNKGILLLIAMESDWMTNVQKLRNKESQETESIVVVGNFIQWINNHPQNVERALIDRMTKEITDLEKHSLLNYLAVSNRHRKQEQDYWKNLLSSCQKSHHGKQNSNNVLLTFFQGKKSVNLEEVVVLLKTDGNMTDVQAKETIRDFIETKFYEIESSEHYLYQSMLKCDEWFPSAQTSLYSAWREFRSSILYHKMHDVLANLDKPDQWPVFKEDEFSLLSSEAKEHFASDLKTLLAHDDYPIAVPPKWENLLISLKHGELTTIYLTKLARQHFFKLIDGESPLRTKLFQTSASFLNTFREILIERFGLAIRGRRPENRQTIQNYVKVFFNSDKELFEKLDNLYFDHLMRLVETSHPDRNLLVHSMQGYDYPNSMNGDEQLFQWLNKQKIFPWNPSIWTLLKNLSSKHSRYKELEQKWRAEWFLKALSDTEVESIVHIQPLGINVAQGGEYVELLFGKYSKSILSKINQDFALFNKWLLHDRECLNLWLACTYQTEHSQHPLAHEIRAIERKRCHDHTHQMLSKIAESLDKPSDLAKLYQEKFVGFLLAGMINPAMYPLDLIYDGLATVLLNADPKTRNWLRSFLKKALFESFSRRFPAYQNLLNDLLKFNSDEFFINKSEQDKQAWEKFFKKYTNDEEDLPKIARLTWERCWLDFMPNEIRNQKWLYKIGTLLDRTQFESLLFIKKAIENETLVKMLLEAPDWMLASEDNQADSQRVFQNTTWSHLIPLLPSSIRAKLHYQLNSCHLPTLTPQSWTALYLARNILQTGIYNSAEGKTLDLIRGEAQNAVNAIIAHESINSFNSEALRSYLWKSWKLSLKSLGIWKSPKKGANAVSWFFGNCRVDPQVIKYFSAAHEQHAFWTEVNDIQVLSRNQALSGIAFDDLFQHFFCGYNVTPYDILKLGNQPCLLIKPILEGMTTFEELEQSEEKWSLDQRSFGARFVQEVIFESKKDHPGYYRLYAKSPGVYALDRNHAEFPEHLSRKPEIPNPHRPAYSDWMGTTETAETPIAESEHDVSFIFSCTEEMHKPLDPSIVDWLCRLDADEVFKAFLIGWNNYSNRLTNLFEDSSDVLMRMNWSSKFNGFHFSQRKFEVALERLKFLQKLLKNNPKLTLINILRAIHPVKGSYYCWFKGIGIQKPIASFNFINEHLKKDLGLVLTSAYVAKTLHLASKEFGLLPEQDKCGSVQESSIKELLTFRHWLVHHHARLAELAQCFLKHRPFEEVLRKIQEEWKMKNEHVATFIKNFVEQYNEHNKEKIELINHYFPSEITWQKIYILSRKLQPKLASWITASLNSVQELHLNKCLINEDDLMSISEAPLLRTLDISGSSIKTTPLQRFSRLFSPSKIVRSFKPIQKSFGFAAKHFFFPNLYIFQADRVNRAPENHRANDPRYPIFSLFGIDDRNEVISHADMVSPNNKLEYIILSPKLCHVSFQDSLAIAALGIGTKRKPHELTCEMQGTVLLDAPKNSNSNDGWASYEFQSPNRYKTAKFYIEKDNVNIFEKIYIELQDQGIYKEFIQLAAKSNALECLQFLLRKANNPRDILGRYQLLRVAYDAKSLEVFEYLCQCSSVASCHFNEFGQSLLHEAILREHWNFVKALSKVQEFLITKDDQGVTPLHLLMQTDAYRLYNYPMSLMNPVDNRGRTVLHYAAMHNSLEMAMLWYNHQSEENKPYRINQACSLQVTPLHLAAFYGHMSMVQWLINENADVLATTRAGTTCLDWAAEQGQDHVVKYLLDLENVGQVLFSESKAIEIAENNQRNSTVKLLREYFNKWFFPANPLFQGNSSRQPSIQFGDTNYLITPTVIDRASGLNALLGVPDDEGKLKWIGTSENILGRWNEFWRPNMGNPVYHDFILFMYEYWSEMRRGLRHQDNWPFSALGNFFLSILDLRQHQDNLIRDIRKFCLQSESFKEDYKKFQRAVPFEMVGGQLIAPFIERYIDWLDQMSRQSGQLSQVFTRMKNDLWREEIKIRQAFEEARNLMVLCKDRYLEQILQPNYQWERVDLMLLSGIYQIPAIFVTVRDRERQLPRNTRVILQNQDGTFCRIEPQL